MKKFSAAILASALLFSLAQAPAYSADCRGRNLVDCLPIPERDIFILDISGSNNVSANWKNSLRPSLIRKLQQPFGFPANKLRDKTRTPYDLFVTAISADSVSQPRIPVVTFEDASKIWGMINTITGATPSSDRLAKLNEDFFGGRGAYTTLAQGLAADPLKLPTKGICIDISTKAWASGFMGQQSKPKQRQAAETICDVYIDIVKRLIQLDSKFNNPKCEDSPCSDVFGAIINAARAAEDMSISSTITQQLCIAISSDMHNLSPTTQKGSALDSKHVALTAKTVEEARQKGKEAAKLIDIRFPEKVKTRIFILSGSGPKPLPYERNAYFNAYWSAFWTEVGIKTTQQIKSLDRACMESGRTTS